MKKLKIGIFSFTGDEGCVINFIEILNYKFFEWIDHIDIKYAKALKSKNVLEDLDVAFVEGAISNKKEVEMIKKVRKNSKKLVAIGTCAIDGSPSNHRNFFDRAKMKEIRPIMKKFGHIKKVVPLKKFVKVDAEVPGCPIIEEKFVECMEKYLKEFGVV
jgi:coenzyme F420-reducing hydrogenase gamma subunit